LTTSPKPKQSASLQVAYLIDQYPAVSHTFIKREIQALERHGVSVVRFALRGWQGELVDADDRRERERTRYVLQGGLTVLALAVVRRAVLAPGMLLAAAALALRLARGSDKSFAMHLASLAEACVLRQWPPIAVGSCAAGSKSSKHGHIAIAALPPYAPELNPVEAIWAYPKKHEIASCAPL
jgi:hypothetical protein